MESNIIIQSDDENLFGFLKNILGNSISIKHGLISEKHQVSNTLFIIYECDFICNYLKCAKKFILMGKYYTIPSIILRPYVIKKKYQINGFFIDSLKTNKLSSSHISILQKLNCSKLFRLSYINSSIYLNTVLKILSIQKEIIDNPFTISCLSDLSNRLNVSLSWLSTNFKNVSGMYLNNYFRKVKCCHALKELVCSQKLIKTIAYEMGYQPMSIARIFQAIFNVTPSFIRSNIDQLILNWEVRDA